MSPSDIATKVEAILFAEGDSLSYKKLQQLTGCDQSQLTAGLDELQRMLETGGLAIVRTELSVALAVSPNSREAVAEALKREQEREIGDAGLEVLAILLYEGPSTRSDVDYIRGVNSSSTMRTLVSRGMVERAGNPEDGREYVYRPTIELLAHLGVTDIKQLPDYATIAQELLNFKMTSHGDTDTTRTDTATG